MAARKHISIYSEWDFSYPIPNSKLTLKGHSRGGERTCFYIPEIRTFFDAGMGSYFLPDRIFVTHCHRDHSFNLPMLISGVQGRAIDIFVPAESAKLFEDFTNSTYRLSQGDGALVSRFPIIPASPGDVLKFNCGGNKYFVKVYDLDHTVPTRGYGLFETRHKLLPEYQNCTPKELVELKKKVKISHDVDIPIILFAFDTSIDPFLKNKELLQFPVIVVECTFLHEKDKYIQHSKHIHWNDIKPIVEQNPQIHFILTHFSMRYSVGEIEEFFKGIKVMAWTN